MRARRSERANFEASLKTLGEWKLADDRFVHCATHGFLNTKRPELSGLVLSLYDREGRPRQGS